MVKGYWYKDVLPFAAMVTVEITNVGLNTLFKAASSQGMSSYVFLCYAYAIATLVLSPMAFVSHRTKVLPPFNMSILRRICLLGVIGFSAEMMSYKGIAYGSPTLASAMSNLTSAFTFILAIIFRFCLLPCEIDSITAAASKFFTLFVLLAVPIWKKDGKDQPEKLEQSCQNYGYHSVNIRSISSGSVQGPNNFALDIIVFFVPNRMVHWGSFTCHRVFSVFCLVHSSAPICFMAERNLSAWRLKLDMTLVVYVYAGFFGSSFSTVVHSWSLQLKGPVYLSSFKPLSIGIAALAGFVFLGDALHLGSVVGVIIISVGFYAVLWGKAKEEEQPVIIRSSSHSQTQTPLLQSQKM